MRFARCTHRRSPLPHTARRELCRHPSRADIDVAKRERPELSLRVAVFQRGLGCVLVKRTVEQVVEGHHITSTSRVRRQEGTWRRQTFAMLRLYTPDLNLRRRSNREPRSHARARSTSIIAGLPLFVAASSGCGRAASVAPMASTAPEISVADLRTRLDLISDDSMMGRESGSEGDYKTAAYVAAEFRRLGLEPAGENGTYFQTVPFWRAAVDVRFASRRWLDDPGRPQ